MESACERLIPQAKDKRIEFERPVRRGKRIRERVPVITADRAWAGLDLGIDVQVIR